MVRLAEAKDLAAMVPLTKVFYDEMNFDHVGNHFDAVVVARNYSMIVASPDKFLCLVAEEEGELVGVMLFAIQDRMLTFQGHKFGQEVEWHSHPKLSNMKRGRIMLQLLMDAEKRLTGIPFYLSTDVREQFDGVGRYLEKRGYIEMCRYWYKGA